MATELDRARELVRLLERGGAATSFIERHRIFSENLERTTERLEKLLGRIICHDCGGSGKKRYVDGTCESCAGTGNVFKEWL